MDTSDSRLRDPSSIFDFFVEITRPKENEESLIKSKFPRDYEFTAELKKQLPKFTWPMRVPNDREEHFTFVLTDLDSKYKFGFCRYPPKGETCMCFMSDLPWFKVFYRALDKISDLTLDHQVEVVEPFLQGLYDHPLPIPGVDTILSVVPNGVDAGQVYSFPLPNPRKLPEIPTDDNLTQFYTNLHYNVILHLFANMIFERRIIITSNSLSLLSSTVEGARMLLYPLHWQHIFIPITPPHLLDYCAAPMPFLMGVHSSYMDLVRRMPTDDIVILDVDESTIESAHVEDLINLPADVVSNLKHVLKKQSSAYGDTVTRTFMLAQVAMIGGYRSALKLRQGAREIVFDEETFFKSRPHMEEFLQKLLHFQHFRQFINSKIEKLKSRNIERDLFDSEVLLYEEELRGSEQVKVVFDKFISSTVEGSKKFAELSGKLGGNIKKQVKQAKVVMKKNLKHKQPYSNRYYGSDGDPPPASTTSPFITTGRANTLPIANRRHTDSATHHGITTPPPNIGGNLGTIHEKSRTPPTVIPYHRHIEGKKKLAQSLKKQSITDHGFLHNLTPPSTPSRPDSADQSSLDHGERISVCSKEEGEAEKDEERVGKEEDKIDVVVGDLIDISSDPDTSKLQASDEGVVDSISTSSLSSCEIVVESSSENNISQQHSWEKFEDSDPPPLPPPRNELEELYSLPIKGSKTPGTKVEFTVIEEESSSLNDLGPIAVALDDSKDSVDLAGSLSNSREKWETFESSETEATPKTSSIESDLQGLSMSTILQPTTAGPMASQSRPVSTVARPSSAGTLHHSYTAPSANHQGSSHTGFPSVQSTPLLSLNNTAQPNRTDLNASSMYPSYPRSATFSRTHYINTNSVLRPIPQEGIANSDYITNPFYTGSINAGHYPPLIPLPEKPAGPRSPNYIQNLPLQGSRVSSASEVPQKHPPTKPKPYSGSYTSQVPATNTVDANGVVLRRRDSSTPFLQQRLPSLGSFDPFGDILTSEGGMASYVMQNPNAAPLQ